MDNDLISRDKAEKLLRKYADEVGCKRGEYERANGILKAACFLSDSENVPATRNADNVVKQVEGSERKFVIVCNEHSSGWLLFWGHRTQDHESRSFGGYTRNIDGCEIYSEDEVKEKGYHFPKYHDGMSWEEFRGYDDILIKPKDLEKLGYKQIFGMCHYSFPTSNLIVRAAKKWISQKVIYEDIGYDQYNDVNVYACICPSCGLRVIKFDDDIVPKGKFGDGDPEKMFHDYMIHHGYIGLNNFCNRCGQRLNWN